MKKECLGCGAKICKKYLGRGRCGSCYNKKVRENERKRVEGNPSLYAYKAFAKGCRRAQKERGLPAVDVDSYENYLVHYVKKNCDLCGVIFDSSERTRTRKAIDHCHKTGKIRGALCFRCNTIEGQVGGLEGALRLIQYLRSRSDA